MNAIEQRHEIARTLASYKYEDIYNMDQTGTSQLFIININGTTDIFIGYFWKQQSDRSLATERHEGFQKNKNRLTIMVCTNADRSDKVSQ